MKIERWDLHVLKQKNTRVFVSKYCMAQSFGKKKGGVYPPPPPPLPLPKKVYIKKILYHDKVQGTKRCLDPIFFFLKMAEATLLLGP